MCSVHEAKAITKYSESEQGKLTVLGRHSCTKLTFPPEDTRQNKVSYKYIIL